MANQRHVNMLNDASHTLSAEFILHDCFFYNTPCPHIRLQTLGFTRHELQDVFHFTTVLFENQPYEVTWIDDTIKITLAFHKELSLK